MMGMSRMCWSILSDKGLYLCHSKCRPPEMTSGHGSGSGWWLQIVWGLGSVKWISMSGWEIDCFEQEMCWWQVTRGWSRWADCLPGEEASWLCASKYKDPAPGRRQTFDPGRSLMFIWPTDGVIASMISTQTKMTDSEYSPQLFTHCLAFIGLHPTKSIPLKINANQTFSFLFFSFSLFLSCIYK